MSETELWAIDAFCAERVMGYTQAFNDDSTPDKVVQFMIDHHTEKNDGRILVSRPYQVGMKDRWFHQWEYFSPTTNPADCALVRKKILEKTRNFDIRFNGDKYACYAGDESSNWRESEEIATCELAKLLFTPP